MLCLVYCIGTKAFSQEKTEQPKDNSVLKIETPKIIFLGNNRQFDIYSSSPDNMIIIKPDSAVRFNMPNTFKIMRGKISIQTIPLKIYPVKPNKEGN